MDAWLGKWVDRRWMDGRTDRMTEWTERRMDGWIDGGQTSVNGWMDGWMGR